MRRATLPLAMAAVVCALAGPSAGAETIKIALPKLLAYPSVPIAIARGYFKAQGLDAEMAFFTTAEPMAIALEAGDVDFAVSGLGAAFYTLAAHGRIRVLASAAIEKPGFFNLAFLGSNEAYAQGLTSAHALPGHSFAITQVGTSLEYSLGLLAEKDGFPLSTIAIKPLQTIPNVVTALAGNRVDAGILPATPALPLLDRGTIKLLGWVSDLVPGATSAVAFTSAKHADADGGLVRRFLIAYRQGSRDYHDAFAGKDDERQDNAAAPAMLDLLSHFTGIPPALIDRAVPFLDPEGRVAMPDLARQIAWYRARHMLRAAVRPEDFVDRRYAIVMPGAK